MQVIVSLNDRASLVVRSILTPFYRSVFRRPELYFHSPCFDGVASAVLALDFLEKRLDWKSVRLVPVNYNVKRWWAWLPLASDAAIVDFLYHPHSCFWADHHATTTVPDIPLATARSGSQLFAFDPEAPSCAVLLQRHLERHLQHRNRFYDELVRWATKIDAARYDTVEEAVFDEAPALRINRALLVGGRPYARHLVERLRTSSLEDAASEPTTAALFARARGLLTAGLSRVKERIAMDEHGIVTFDVTRDGVMVERYAPYVFFPDAVYSVGLVRSRRGIAITAMRNPWREFRPVHLGRLFKPFGGGGHERVASVVLRGRRARRRAHEIMESVVNELRRSAPTEIPLARARTS